MRYQTHLRQRYRMLLGYSGALMLTIGLIFLLPLLLLLFYPEEAVHAKDFLLAGLPLMVIGVVLWRWLAPREPLSLTVQEGAVIIFGIWAIASVIGCLPFMTVLGLNFTQAVFEAVSGWTTTGLSVVDVEEAPRIILLYRSLLQLAGGAGFVIITLSALAGPAGPGLSTAEGRSEQLAPHVRQSAAIVVRIYVSYVILGILGLYVAGMDWFDAINHAFTAVATGGFSTKPDSIGYWDSGAIEGVIIILMLLGQLNFLTAYTLLNRKFRPFILNGEVRLVALVLPVSVIMLLVMVCVGVYPALDKALRVAFFEVSSALSGTGFSTVTYHGWNEVGWLILIGLMILGGGSGSTAGGIKQIRIYMLYKGVVWELRRAFMPRHMVNEPAIWHGEERGFLSDSQLRQVALFAFLYLTLLFTGTVLTAAHGYGLAESLFEYASTLGTVGLSLGITGADTPLDLLWIQILGMFLGRLEIFVVITGLLKLIADSRTLIERPANGHH